MSGRRVLSVLVTWEMGSGYGHLMRLQPVVRRLQQHGHRLALATLDVARTQAVFTDLPCYQAPCNTLHAPDFPFANTFAEIMHNIGCESLPSIQMVTRSWQALARLVQADVIIMDFSPMALLAFQGYPARRVLIDNGYSHPPDAPRMPFLRPWENAYQDMHDRVEQEVLANVNDYLTGCGLQPLPYLAALFRRVESINLITLPELDHTGPKPYAHYRGYISTGGERPDWPSAPASSKRLFVYLKPLPELDRLLAQLMRLDVVVLAVVPGCDEALLQKYKTAPRLRLTDRLFDIRLLGDQADYALCGGGDVVGTMLLCGTPVCVLPYFPEQRLTALRAAATGAALVVDANRNLPGADAILSVLRQLMNTPALACKAREFARRYQNLQPAQQVDEIVAAIENDNETH